MATSTRTCDAPGCGLVATLTPLTPAVSRVVWPDGSGEHLRELPTNGTIRCQAHRAGYVEVTVSSRLAAP